MSDLDPGGIMSMRLRFSAIVCILALSSVWSQDVSAGVFEPSGTPSAYDILGVSSLDGDVQTPSTPALNVVDVTVVVEDSPVVEEEATVVEEEATVVEEEVTVVVEEVTVVVEDSPVVEVSDEQLLMAEIERLLVERDELYGTINELRAENLELAEQAGEAEYFIKRVAELEIEITRLEGIIVENEAALVAADTRLAEIEAQLVEEGGRLADAEARLAATDGGTAAVASMLAGKDAELSVKDAELSVKATEISIKVAELTEKDALIASMDDELRVRESTIAAKDEAIASMKAKLEATQAEAAAALAAAKATGTVVQVASATPAMVAVPVASKATSGYLSGWELDTSKFTKKLRDGFGDSSARMGSWKIVGAMASQADSSQYFSRLELPLAQGKAPMLYRFKARSTGKGWIGLGLHLYVEDVLKKRGYGEGKSLLVWFTRDSDARGDDATYLQLYRSDNDVVMERMFDAELADGIESWRLVEVVYDPGAEYIAVSVDGVLRIVYKTFFGRDAGATAALRTLGGGVSFSEFSAWTE